MDCRQIQKSEISDVIRILEQDTLRYADGEFPQEDWIINFFNTDRGYVLGAYEDIGGGGQTRLVGVLIAEQLLGGGVMLWYIAFQPENRGKGYGKILMEYFESMAKSQSRNWIFLNATPDSIGFHQKNGFISSKYSGVFEHCKDL